MAKKKVPEYTITCNAQITAILNEEEFKNRRTEEDLAKKIKDVLNVDDVVIFNYKVFAGQK